MLYPGRFILVESVYCVRDSNILFEYFEMLQKMGKIPGVQGKRRQIGHDESSVKVLYVCASVVKHCTTLTRC